MNGVVQALIDYFFRIMTWNNAEEMNWWAWVDLNYRPHPYQLSPTLSIIGCDS